MTLDQAENIRKLMTVRDMLYAELNELERCQSISGTINDGVNGRGFAWRNEDGDRHILYLTDGINKHIAEIEDEISDMKGE